MSDLDVLRELTGRLQPPAYDDLVAVSRKRRRRSLTSGAAAVAAAVVVVTIAVIGSNGGGARPQPAPVPQPPTSTPRPEPTRTSSSETWVDTDVASAAGGLGWAVPDPLQSTREGWFSVLSDHFDPNGERFTPDGYGGFIVEIPGPGGFVEYGNAGVLFDRGDGRTLAEGCQHFVSGLPGEPCSRKRLAGPHGERAWVYQRPCCGYIDVSPTPMSDDYGATVAVERDDGTIGYVEEHWRGGPDASPYDLDDLAGAAQRAGVGDAVEALDDLRPRSAQAQHRAPGRDVVETGDRLQQRPGGAREDVEDARADLDLLGLRSQVAHQRGGVEAVGLGHPHEVEARALEVDDLVGRGARVAVVHEHGRELHDRHASVTSAAATRRTATRHAGELK